MKLVLLTQLSLAMASIVTVIILSPSALAQHEDPDAKQKGFSNLSNTGRMISMVIEPDGKQLKIYLTGNRASDIKMENATVEASYFVAGVKKSLPVKRQTDSKNRKSFYLIDKFDSSMKNMKINVKAGKYIESFDLPDLQ